MPKRGLQGIFLEMESVLMKKILMCCVIIFTPVVSAFAQNYGFIEISDDGYRTVSICMHYDENGDGTNDFIFKIEHVDQSEKEDAMDIFELDQLPDETWITLRFRADYKKYAYVYTAVFKDGKVIKGVQFPLIEWKTFGTEDCVIPNLWRDRAKRLYELSHGM